VSGKKLTKRMEKKLLAAQRRNAILEAQQRQYLREQAQKRGRHLYALPGWPGAGKPGLFERLNGEEPGEARPSLSAIKGGGRATPWGGGWGDAA
jgi:hypothetical protein